LATLAVATLAGAGALYPDKLFTRNGGLMYSTVAGVLIERHTAPDARLAVLAGGGAPYFSRRYAIDLLGKSDPVIARQAPACCNDVIGHNKFDVDYSLGKAPDLLQPLISHELNLFDWWLDYQERTYGVSYNTAIVQNETFRARYLPNPIEIEYLMENMPLYVRDDSPEAARRLDWVAPEVAQ
jgi:hypothetical protein